MVGGTPMFISLLLAKVTIGAAGLDDSEVHVVSRVHPSWNEHLAHVSPSWQRALRRDLYCPAVAGGVPP